jgi:hypothetical protein
MPHLSAACKTVWHKQRARDNKTDNRIVSEVSRCNHFVNKPIRRTLYSFATTPRPFSPTTLCTSQCQLQFRAILSASFWHFAMWGSKVSLSPSMCVRDTQNSTAVEKDYHDKRMGSIQGQNTWNLWSTNWQVQVLLCVLRFSPLSNIPPMFRTQSIHLPSTLYNMKRQRLKNTHLFSILCIKYASHAA